MILRIYHLIPDEFLHKKARIIQNFMDVDFFDDSDEDREWEPEAIFMDKNTEKTSKKKKKITAGPSSTNKKVKLSKEFFCDICQIDFTRKYNLRRHNIKKHC